jgi:hypothetical protein
MLQNIMAEKDKIMRNAPLKAFASPLKADPKKTYKRKRKRKIEKTEKKEIKL